MIKCLLITRQQSSKVDCQALANAQIHCFFIDIGKSRYSDFHDIPKPVTYNNPAIKINSGKITFGGT